ncbi:GDSL-type esterase/lipase family protein [Sphingomonas sp. SUN019]|uniref:GDSL-type esterase/lipase family protein n=1 Tax=Sphingomonas sp. SUN019 TaxID=2937788 RepID=UPI0021643044|nr:GDSL-type esterase/lipase family protein [Sphingomonas sp. SUN019]UVO50564.1 GDSL-type esterase/lipase family protein [Sphingomonas sp. SUN019]
MIARRTLIGSVALAGLATAARAEDADAARREDWPQLGRYAADNRRLADRGERVGIVFLGDSITEGWRDKRPGFFTSGRVNRGIGGQTSPQMLLRVMADVVALRPRAMHLMAGTNDIAGNTGPMTVVQTQGNLRAIVQLARANGIAVLLASVPPAARFPWRPGVETIAPINALNAWARAAAPALGATFVDYTPALADARGAMKPGLASDGVHPTQSGYDAMAAILSPILARLTL